jgi:uncharacterized protein involved in exopolysaccharide biosynthesis
MENKIIKGDEIDLLALVKAIWAGRKVIYYTVSICLFIGVIIAYTSPKKYNASATLLPSAEKKSGSLGGLSSLAGLAGVNLGNMLGDASGIPAELYPQVVASLPYLMDLMHEKFIWEKYDQPMSIIEKMTLERDVRKESLILKYTLKLPWTIKDSFSKEKRNLLAEIKASDSVGYIQLKPEEQAAIGLLKQAIKVEKDPKNSLVIVNVEMDEPLLAAQLADKAVALLQKKVIAYKTKQSVEKMKFIEDRYNEVKKEYETSRLDLMYYRDVHRNLVDERVDNSYQELNDEYDMASTLYKGLAQQLEQARISVKEETPVFSVLEPVVVPKSPSAPRKTLILAVSIFLGGFFGVCIVLSMVLFTQSKMNKTRTELRY